MLTAQRQHLIRYARSLSALALLGSFLFTFSGASTAHTATRTAPTSSNSFAPANARRQPANAFTTNVVTEWNQHAATLSIATASALAPVQQNRVMAIVQLAMHDAINGMTREFETYLTPGSAPDGASVNAAAIAAAHYALRNLFTIPSQLTLIDALYTASLDAHGITLGDPGIGYGESAAAAILELRSSDNSALSQFDYIVPGVGSPGVWERLNNAPALLPGWGNVKPFVLNSGSQFRPEAPPPLSSAQYARDYNEIKQVGVQSGSTRTTEQTDIALFWRASPTAIWNPVLNQAIGNRDFTLSETARIFALFYLAASDTSVACWDAKYVYNFWRPMLAIRGGDTDGNDATVVDETWTPLLPTPPHPEYPSGHSSVSSSMATVLELMFGAGGGPIVVTISPITRQWSSFEEAVEEVIDARVYSGIHFRTADEAGARMGRQIARYVATHALRPCRGSGARC